jgi:hypothetical protein
LKNRDDYNNFDVTRAYLNINAQVSKNVRFRFTPDIRRINDGSLSGSLVLRVKYAFAQFDNITPKAWIRLGAHQTPWLDFEEGIDRYRVQGTMFSEREALIPGSSDFGASYFTPLPGEYGEVHGGVYNGEGFGQPEANKYKSVQVRGTVRPLPHGGAIRGLRVSGFYNAGWYAADRPRRLGIVMGSFEHKHIVGTLQALKATERPTPLRVNVDRTGWSAFVEPRQEPRASQASFATIPSTLMTPSPETRRTVSSRVARTGSSGRARSLAWSSRMSKCTTTWPHGRTKTGCCSRRMWSFDPKDGTGARYAGAIDLLATAK